jgi:hypothetical protein
MKSVILPDVTQICSSFELSEFPAYDGSPPTGVLWFPDNSSREQFGKLMEVDLPQEIFLTTSCYGVELLVKVGAQEADLVHLRTAVHRIVCLPLEGVGDRRLMRALNRRKTLGGTHFFRLFRSKDLGVHRGEFPPLIALWQETRDSFGASPFMTLEDRLCYSCFSHWLALVVAVASVKRRVEEARKYLIHLRSKAGNFLAIDPLQKLVPNSQKSLKDLLIVREKSMLFLSEIEDMENTCETYRNLMETLQKESDLRSRNAYVDVNRKTYDVDFDFCLGCEIHPRLQWIIQQLVRFADRLKSSKSEDLAGLGSALQLALQKRTPRLVLAGSFSAGKTTLLNLLLFGNGTRRAFRTANVANTAIVSELWCPAVAGREEVTFQIKDRVDHLLYERSPDGIQETEAQNLEALSHLVRWNVLRSPSIRIEKKSSNKAAVIYSGRTQCLSALTNIYTSFSDKQNITKVHFLASVDEEAVITRMVQELPRSIDLATSEGWVRFQGDRRSPPFVETPFASFLIESADVKLDNDLLKITTLADTPGTGTIHDRHDVITDQYLNRADGFVILLPTKVLHAKRVQDLLDKLKKELVRRHKQALIRGLDSVAFVVNVFSDHTESTALKRIGQFEQMIRDTFSLSGEAWRQRRNHRDKNNFFVIRLKNLENAENPENLYGFPSFVPLKNWITRLFRSGAYRERLVKVLELVDEQWSASRRTLEKRLRDTELKESDRADDIAQLEDFINNQLYEISKECQDRYSSFRRAFHSGQNSIRERISAALDDFVSDAHEVPKKQLFLWRDRIERLFDQSNELLDDLEEGRFLEIWVEDLKEHPVSEALSLLRLVLPSEQSSDGSWSLRDRLSADALRSQFNETKSEWPGMILGLLGRLRHEWEETSKRTRLAQEIQGFVEAQYARIWGKGLEDYLNRCEGFVDTKTRELKEQCQEKKEELEEGSNDERVAELEKRLRAFDSVENERKRLVKELRTEIEQC